jgi:hypothetical protein
VPKKKETISDDERTKRILDASYQVKVDDDPASFERVFAAVARAARKPGNLDKEKKGSSV